MAIHLRLADFEASKLGRQYIHQRYRQQKAAGPFQYTFHAY